MFEGSEVQPLSSPGRERLQVSIFHLQVHPPPEKRLQVCILYLQVHLPTLPEKRLHVFLLHLPSSFPKAPGVHVASEWQWWQPEPFCDLPVRAQKEKKVTLHLTPVSGLMMWRGGNSQNGPHSPWRQASSSKENLYWSLCQGEVVVEKVRHFCTSLLLKRNYPKENFLLLRWDIGLIQVGEC